MSFIPYISRRKFQINEDHYVIGYFTTATTDGAIGDFTSAISDGAIASCAVVMPQIDQVILCL